MCAWQALSYLKRRNLALCYPSLILTTEIPESMLWLEQSRFLKITKLTKLERVTKEFLELHWWTVWQIVHKVRTLNSPDDHTEKSFILVGRTEQNPSKLMCRAEEQFPERFSHFRPCCCNNTSY